MPKNNEIRANGNNSTVPPTSYGTKAVIILLQENKKQLSLHRLRQRLVFIKSRLWVYFILIHDIYTYKTYRLSNPTDTHNSFMCTVFGETGGDSLSYLHSTLTYPKMPKTGSHRVKPNNSTPNSTHAASVKAVITIFMLVLTFINPVLFIIPTALCGYALSKSNPV
jgi:hypothetical protein